MDEVVEFSDIVQTVLSESLKALFMLAMPAKVFSPLFLGQSAILFLVSFFALTAQAELQVKDGYVRAMPPGQPNTAAFMLVTNSSNEAIKLVAASTDKSKKAEFHNHTMDDKGVMRMRAVESVEVPAGGQFEFKPGAFHVMVMGLTQPLKPSQTVKLQLKDASGKVYEYSLPVKSLVAGNGAQKHEHHGHHHHH